jgi:hypothetical protein
MKVDGRCHCGFITFEAEIEPGKGRRPPLPSSASSKRGLPQLCELSAMCRAKALLLVRVIRPRGLSFRAPPELFN